MLPALPPPPGNEGPSRLRLTPSFACPLASCFLSLACGFHAQIALANLHKPTAPTSPSSPGLRILTRLHDSFALTQASTAGGHPMAGWPHTARVSSPATMFMAPSTLVCSRSPAARSRADTRGRARRHRPARERCAGEPRPGRQRHCTHWPPSHAHASLLARMLVIKLATNVGFRTC